MDLQSVIVTVFVYQLCVYREASPRFISYYHVAQGELVKEVLCHVAFRVPSLLLRINTH